MTHDIKYLNAFAMIPGVKPSLLRLLKERFGSFEAAWHASNATLQNAGATPVQLEKISWKRPSMNPDREMAALIKEGIWMVHEEDERFPASLKAIPAPPYILYGRGESAALENNAALPNAIAVVGSRKPTSYGLEATQSLVSSLAARGIAIISGMALGVDTRAHETALEMKGVTVAVLGSGVDETSVYPRENKGLLKRIISNGGAVVSEFAPGTPPLKEHFPQRNRIIAGLSRGVLVIEAREKSGALITARFALEQGRDVFAVPGSIFSLASRGPHTLIQEGAKLATSAEDILTEFGIEYTKTNVHTEESMNEREQMILALLEEPRTVDILKAQTGLETGAIVASLSLLELHGQIRHLDGDTFQRTA